MSDTTKFSMPEIESRLSPKLVASTLAALSKANKKFARIYPGYKRYDQPVQVLYGGADRFQFNLVQKMSELALQAFDTYAPDVDEFAYAMGLEELSERLQKSIYERVRTRLLRQPLNDARVDFEDGFGYRSDEEEDYWAWKAACEMARAMRERRLPPFIGIRIKPLNDELAARAVRTLDVFIATLCKEAGGLPPNFVVTLPKVTIPEQVQTAVKLCEQIEAKYDLAPESLQLELMVETPQCIVDSNGNVALGPIANAAGRRLRGMHFGTYDYTALVGVSGHCQSMGHQACVAARQMMLMALSGRTWLSDGATNIMPVGPHKAPKGGALTPQQAAENKRVVHAAWRKAFDDVSNSLNAGLYQGWDLHPNQLISRYAANYAFFLKALPGQAARLKEFIKTAAQATLSGNVFDDEASAQGLLNFMSRAISLGAVTEEEVVMQTGLTAEQIRSRSFKSIVAESVNKQSGKS